MNEKTLILDIDGVILRWTGHHRLNVDDFSSMFKALTEWRNENGKIFVLTSRPPSQMPIIAYFLGLEDGYLITEEGASYYNVKDNRTYITDKWIEYSEVYVPQLRGLLLKELEIRNVSLIKDHAQIHSSTGPVITLIIPPGYMNEERYIQDYLYPLLAENNLDTLFDVSFRRVINIKPKNLAKHVGMELLLKLNKINPSKKKVFYIADSKHDLSAAEYLVNVGGKIGVVGNGDEVLKDFARKTGGIIADDSTEYHSSILSILNTEKRRI